MFVCPVPRVFRASLVNTWTSAVALTCKYNRTIIHRLPEGEINDRLFGWLDVVLKES